ncbi:conjugal transfer protein TraW [Parasutterella sp.]|uniref:conjugal transfer protein TraW n=1 Tax=Parasutterella sp. TaxID=2049037 RepID=UPI003AEFC1EB
MNLTRAILSTCAVASSIVCISAYSVASSEPSVSFTSVKPCAKETASKPKVEILEAFKSRVGAMKASGDYDRRFNQNKERIAKELEHPTPVAGLKKATEIRVWELSASVPETLPESLLRQAQSVPMPHLSRSLLFIDGRDAKSIGTAQKLYQSQKDMRVVLVNGTPAEVSEKLNRRVFFDQGGALVRVFGIKAVPALLFNGPEGPEGAEFAPDQLSELLSLMPQP